MNLLKSFSTIILFIALAGCSAIGELAYDEAASRDRAACERMASMSDRQACLQRVNTAARQAEAVRKRQ